jgi:hypothetical protein
MTAPFDFHFQCVMFLFFSLFFHSLALASAQNGCGIGSGWKEKWADVRQVGDG